MKIAFRADGSREIGLGHLYRCKALAEALSEKEAEIVFLTKTGQESEYVLGKSAKVTKIENENQFIDFIASEKIGTVVIDHYGIDSATLERVKTAAKRLACIDDLNSLDFYPVDIIVNQNIYAKSLEYNCPKETTVLAGTKYAMLRKEFRQLAGREKKPNAIPKILVSFGGSDPKGMTLLTAKALKGIKEKFNAVFVLGKAFSKEKELETELKDGENSFEIRKCEENMAELMLECDFAISHAGTMINELAFSRLPAITICQAENQYRLAEEMEKAGFSKNLGKAENVSQEEIAKAVKEMMQDKDSLKKGAENGRKLVDGLGAERVASEIVKIV